MQSTVLCAQARRECREVLGTEARLRCRQQDTQVMQIIEDKGDPRQLFLNMKLSESYEEQHAAAGILKSHKKGNLLICILAGVFAHRGHRV